MSYSSAAFRARLQLVQGVVPARGALLAIPGPDGKRNPGSQQLVKYVRESQPAPQNVFVCV